MSNLTDNGTTSWFKVSPHTTATASASGDFGGGTLAIQIKDLDASGTAVALAFPSGVANTDDYAVTIENGSGQVREYRFSLSGATSPDINCFIE